MYIIALLAKSLLDKVVVWLEINEYSYRMPTVKHQK